MSGVQLYQSRVFCIVWHLVALGQFIYAFYYDNTYVTIPEHTKVLKVIGGTEFAGRSKFLTYWNMVSKYVWMI